MHSTTTLVAATAVYASLAAAHPHYARQANATEAWGSWIVTSPSSSYPPSGSHKSLDFLVRYESQADAVHCSATFPGDALGFGDEQPYTPCDDEAVSFTADWAIGNVWLKQKLYQRGAIVELKGNTSLHLYGGNCTVNAVGGGTCYGPPFKVPVISAITQFGNSTVDGNNSTTPADDQAGDEGNTEDSSSVDGGNSEDAGSAADDTIDNSDQDDGTSQDSAATSDDDSGANDGASNGAGPGPVEEESTTTKNGKPEKTGYPHGHGGPYQNTTSFSNDRPHRNTTAHGGHQHGKDDA